MLRDRLFSYISSAACILAVLLHPLQGQNLQEDIRGIFSQVLELRLAGSPGEHGQHFFPGNVSTSLTTINAFSNLIVSNISAFPLSSTVAGLTFDFSSGAPVATSTSLGPIFAERGQTLGRGRFNVGMNLSFLDLSRLRGVKTEDLRFTFAHQNVPPDVNFLGDSPNEFDNLDLFLNLDLSATVFALYFTAGVTNRLDVGLAVPFINVNLKARPLARINSFTFLTLGQANHFFGGDSASPVLTSEPEPVDANASGIGDLAFRAKYQMLKGEQIDLAALAEVRVPTGEKENFLGAGEALYKFSFVASTTVGDFSPHLNVSYLFRDNSTERDKVEIIFGYDQKVGRALTVASEFVARLESGSQPEDARFPTSVTARRPDGSFQQTISLTNIPALSRDNVVDVAFGLRFSPTPKIMLIGNVFAPVNSAGLRSDFIPTFGFEATL